jgi:hypothetical protein
VIFMENGIIPFILVKIRRLFCPMPLVVNP